MNRFGGMQSRSADRGKDSIGGAKFPTTHLISGPASFAIEISVCKLGIFTASTAEMRPSFMRSGSNSESAAGLAAPSELEQSVTESLQRRWMVWSAVFLTLSCERHTTKKKERR